MTPAEVQYSVDERFFAGVEGGINAAISVWEEEGGLAYGCAVRPGLDAQAERTAVQWFAELITHLEDYGLGRAVEMDGWQRRSDGKYQLLGRQHHLPSLD